MNFDVGSFVEIVFEYGEDADTVRGTLVEGEDPHWTELTGVSWIHSDKRSPQIAIRAERIVYMAKVDE